MRGRTLLALALLVAPACDGREPDPGKRDADAAAPSTTTTALPAPSTAAPTTTTTTTVVAAAPARPASPPCPAVPERRPPPAGRPRYTLSVDVRPDANDVVGSVDVAFAPDRDTDRLVFRLWPNGPRPARGGARLDVGRVTLDGAEVRASQPDATTLDVPVAGGLRAGEEIRAAVEWRLVLPGAVNDRISRSGDAIRLGSFFPILAWEPGAGWGREPPTSGFAEASVAQTADFTASVSVPPGLDVLATGTQDASGRWVASAVPDFALTVGRFRRAATSVDLPNRVSVTVGVHDTVADSPDAYLRRVTRSLTELAQRYGPYPWPSFSLAITPQLGGGIEYPMHVMQGPGTTGRTTSHEVAHQWFYGLVANHQGRDPWLDEGLASWAEAMVDGTLQTFRSRTMPAEARGRAGEPMTYWESRQGSYYRGVYVQPVQALAALGPPDRVDCALRLYVATNAFAVARPAALVAALEAVFPGAAATLARYGLRA